MKLRFGRLAAALVVIGLLILGILLIAGGGKKSPSTPVKVPKSLTDYASTDATVSLTIKGAINAQELHREIRVTIGRGLRQVDIIKGYQNQIIKDKSYDNTQAAYDEFLHAINYANFTRTRKANLASESGVCPLGNRCVFALEKGGRKISRLWTSTCSGAARGTFGGNTTLLLTLFEKQIPTYDALTQRVRLQ